VLDLERDDKEVKVVALNAIGKMADGVFEWDAEGDFIEDSFPELCQLVPKLRTQEVAEPRL